MGSWLKNLLIGKEKDPFCKKTRQSIALTAFFAWVGLGADGLSSACYGPQEAFLALGQHPQLALYLAIAMGISVFIISFAYNQVIDLFPNGGGGYKVATVLLGPQFGVIAGSALLVDYVLTITISVAAGAEALFSLIPLMFHTYILYFEFLVIVLLTVLNLRGMKEAIKVLFPIFLGFVLTHVFMILYGIFRHDTELPRLFTQAHRDIEHLSASHGLFFMLALFLHAYSIGGGSYTGLEAVSNKVDSLAEPRQATGKLTMFYLACSLSLVAAGILLLYLLWDVKPVTGQTMNAIAFRALLHDWKYSEWIVSMTLLFEFGLLFVGANTGFMGGPAVLSNMAMNKWVPRRFLDLSSRLVSQNGILLFSLASILILIASKGSVGLLIILYSTNVFMAFSVAILGLCKYWIFNRPAGWVLNFSVAFIALIVCVSILFIVIFSRFWDGGIESILLTFTVIIGCYYIRNHYIQAEKKLIEADKRLAPSIQKKDNKVPEFDPKAMTAVFLLGESRGADVHGVNSILKLFPNHFKNFIALSAGAVDVHSYGGEKSLQLVKDKQQMRMSYFIKYIHNLGFPLKTYESYGIDPVEEYLNMASRILKEVPNCVFFATKLVPKEDNWLIRTLHNEVFLSVQRGLFLEQQEMMVLPMIV